RISTRRNVWRVFVNLHWVTKERVRFAGSYAICPYIVALKILDLAQGKRCAVVHHPSSTGSVTCAQRCLQLLQVIKCDNPDSLAFYSLQGAKSPHAVSFGANRLGQNSFRLVDAITGEKGLRQLVRKLVTDFRRNKAFR